MGDLSPLSEKIIHMKKCNHLFLLAICQLILQLFVGYGKFQILAKETFPPNVPIETNTQDSLPIEMNCSITAEKSAILTGQPFEIIVTLQNTSSENRQFKVIPSFRLELVINQKSHEKNRKTVWTKFWCPVDLSQENTSLSANQEALLRIEKNSAIEVKADLQKLFWGKSGYSVWPSENLSKIIPQGQYKLFLEVSVLEVTGDTRTYDFEKVENHYVFSNSINVSIKEK